MEKEILEGNKLIKEFYTDEHLRGQFGRILSVEEYKYHTSWDWLMPVVDKIENEHKIATMMYVNSWDNRGRYCFSIYREIDDTGGLRHRFVEIVSESKIKSIWLGVIEFIRIKNYNLIPTTQEFFDLHRNEYQRRIDILQYGE